MDFFSRVPLYDELSGLSQPETKCKLEEFTFSNFLKARRVREFLRAHAVAKLPAMRYVYVYYLFSRIGDYIGDDTVLAIFGEFMGVSDAGKGRGEGDGESDVHGEGEEEGDGGGEAEPGAGPDIPEVYRVCECLPVRTKCRISLAIEAITRGQYENNLWEIFRDGIISSSKFYHAVRQQNSSKKLFQPWPIVNNYYPLSPLAFGLRCEDAVKTLLAEFVCGRKEVMCDVGFLQSPKDGIFGVSLDMCANVSVGRDNLLEFRADAEIYEIKCRFKYNYSKIECDPLYQKYVSLYNSPSKTTLIRFLSGINRPAVEYVPPGKLPTKNDFLLTSDRDWDLSPKRKRNLTPAHKSLYDCLRANEHASSQVLILSDPSETEGKIDIKARFDVDVFINPEHSYFYQILLQYKVVKNYIQYHSSPGLGSLKTFIVSGFFRKRNHSDPLECSIGGRGTLDSACEIPVLLILTPVYIPHCVVTESLKKASQYWNQSAEEEFSHPPWVSSSLFADGDMTP
ncbi:deoxyribonuclease [Equid gammaherpesvirus 2]|nr:deoxyribonuclease [Equid gammaherpesvirus 2]UTM05598.1 deoxyribonuclease [Equid gammaherpesvirus 2]